MSVMLRAAQAKDAATVASLFGDSFTETFGHLYEPADLHAFLERRTAVTFAAEILDPDFRVQLAFMDGAPVGFAKLGPPDLPVEAPPGTIELRQLYVLERATGAGVGTALIEWALETARATGARFLQLSVYVDNHRARRFYDRRGFETICDYNFMVGNHADHDIVMRVTL